MFHRIKILRTKSKMSQAQLANLLHISASTVGMYEQGRRSPSLDILIQMSNIFGVSLDYLITGKDYTSLSDEFTSNYSADNCPCNTCYWKKQKLHYFET